MMYKGNKGVSMVEVLIALAIFMILLFPLVSSLVSSMKSTTSAKELQYRNEYAHSLMENVKEVPASVLDDASATIAYFGKMGSKMNVDPADPDYSYKLTTNDVTGTHGTYPYKEYVIKGNTYLGTNRTEYAYAIQISNKEYAKLQADEADPNKIVDPNNQTSSMVEDLDREKVAIISASLSNYDKAAYDSLLTQKIAEYKEYDATFDVAKDVSKFQFDEGTRIIDVKVEGGASMGYDVTCTVHYFDSCDKSSAKPDPNSTTGRLLTIGEVVGVSYVPYKQHFKELPNIYVMYNMGVYNDNYTKDYITFDLSSANDVEEAKAFIVATAEDYAKDLADTNTDNGGNWLWNKTANGTAVDVLYKKKADGTKRTGKEVKLAGVNCDKLQVYHNFDILSSAATAASTQELKIVNSDTVKADMTKYMKSTSYTELPNVGGFNKALKDIRGLYNVKIWIQEGSTPIDIEHTTLSPILQGTRGGDEID